MNNEDNEKKSEPQVDNTVNENEETAPTTMGGLLKKVKDKVAAGELTRDMLLNLRAQFGITQADYTRKQTTKAKRKAKRISQRLARRKNRGTTKGQKTSGRF